MKWLSIRSLLISSAIFRLILIVYGEWQDAHMEVRFTDVDYLVFSNAASLMASGHSPYKRTTYRYSPLLAFLLIPNSLIHRAWGKFIFSISDLLVGLFIHSILKLRKVPEDLCLCSVMVWLLNPFTFTIGTRGNCEPIVCAMILWIIICLMNGKVVQAAFWYGFVVHFRIYPIIYAIPIILVLDPHLFQSGQKPLLVNWRSSTINATQRSKEASGLCRVWTALKSMLTRERVTFGLVSGSVFFSCTGLFFYLYQWEFLNEALLYHLTRTDPRHNFTIYFYHIYLHYEHEFSVVEKLISFLPQLIAQLAPGKNDKDLTSESMREEIKSCAEHVKKLLEVTPPKGKDFLSKIEHILDREKNWVWWKRDGCPPFEKQSTEKAAQDGNKKRRPRWRMGNKELSQLWKWADQNPNALTDPQRVRTPAITEYWKPLAEDMDPAAGIEGEYHHKNNRVYCWKGRHFSARQDLDGFSRFTEYGIEGVVPLELLPSDVRSKYQTKPNDRSKRAKTDEAKGSSQQADESQDTQNATTASETDGERVKVDVEGSAAPMDADGIATTGGLPGRDSFTGRETEP